MHRSLIIVVLSLSLCSSMVLAGDIKAQHTAITTTFLDTGSADNGPIGAIINALNKADAWIQRNIW